MAAIVEPTQPTAIHRGEDDLPFVTLPDGLGSANLNLDAEGNVELVIDAHSILPFYRMLCESEHGIADPAVVVIES